MFEPAYRRRAKPSARNLVFSLVVFAAALTFTLAAGLFGSRVYLPLAVGAASALGVAFVRTRGVRLGLPKPYGSSRVIRIDSKRSARDGLLLVLGGIVVILGLFGSVELVSPFLFFFPVTFGLMMGLPLSQALFFALVSRLEGATHSTIFIITEDITENGKEVLLKSIEAAPVTASAG